SANQQPKRRLPARQFLSLAANENDRVCTLLEIKVQHFIAHREAALLNIAALLNNPGQQIVKLSLKVSDVVLLLSISIGGNRHSRNVLLFRQDLSNHRR